jgi:crotonobetainyl-CoA:carnitine CoA-transferase CaiB-like acyl-CoA transferase
MARDAAEWDAHPQGEACRRAGPVTIEKIGDSAPEDFPEGGTRPLAGLRVLDLTRILAGPTCARTLAEHGAEVLHITSPQLDSVRPFVIDTGPGKRSASLHLNEATDVETLRRLVAGADVFSQGYRSGGLARRGLAPRDLAALRPGIVYVSINCYGHEGPWVARPGWDQLAGAVSGLSVAQGAPGAPVQMPAAACDYVTGYLGALGTMAALRRRAVEGGSYHVKVSLAQTATWLRDFAAMTPADPAPDFAVPDALFQETSTPFGKLRHLKPATRLSATPTGWALPAVPLGTHAAAWVG